jgi:hypothetical protein
MEKGSGGREPISLTPEPFSFPKHTVAVGAGTMYGVSVEFQERNDGHHSGSAVRGRPERTGTATRHYAGGIGSRRLACAFSPASGPLEPRDEWERRLLGMATDCGVSLTNEQLSREEMYE